MDKKALGQKIYNVCLALTTGILISGGSVVREYLSGEYLKKKMMLKLIVLGSSLLVGTLLMILFYKAIVYLAVFMLGLGTLMFVVVPTVTKEEKK